MKELNLSVSAGGDGKENQVVLTAKFDTHTEAVAFHDGLARLCRDSAKPLATRNMFGGNPLKMLARS